MTPASPSLSPEVAIRVSGVSKQYSIGGRRRGQDTIREQLTARVRSLLRGGLGRSENATHLALRDVSFDVARGEVVGIIGRNGAGKSTLLKILARVTTPSAGHAQIRGRLGALLEVGTGFHPELTGRENVYLNGAILGMTRAEVARKFDEIIDFAEIHKFVDTPVKRYSSGMYVRLAFAVAAHLEPDILIVDEALAVGDFAFQRKCLGRLQAQAGSGRTVLFVSHNIGAIRMLCSRCLLLEDGRVVLDGPVDAVIEKYVEQLGQQSAAKQVGPRHPDVGSGFLLHPRDPVSDLTIFCGEAIVFDFDIEAEQPPGDARVGVSLRVTTPTGEYLVTMDSVVQRAGWLHGEEKRWNVRCDLGRLPLNEGAYFVWVTVCVYVDNTVKRFARFTNAFALHVLERDVFGWGNSLPRSRYWGPLYWAPEWQIQP
ncbi:MAG: polysaccharide ABC transporter ATP-binding protein, partial [Acidobacteriota bacterium]